MCGPLVASIAVTLLYLNRLKERDQERGRTRTGVTRREKKEKRTICGRWGAKYVVQPLKLSRSKPVFSPPKGGKLRDVPLPGPVADVLRAHMKRFPPVEITLPWKVADGPRCAARTTSHARPSPSASVTRIRV